MKIDKVKHFAVGFVLGFSAIIVQNKYVGAVISLGSGLLFVWKEEFDRNKPNPTGFSIADIVADVLGFGFGMTVATWVLGVVK